MSARLSVRIVRSPALACAALLALGWLAPQEPPAPQAPAAQDEELRALEQRLADTEDALVLLELDVEANRAERRGLRPAHTRARRLDEEHAALLRRREALTAERAALRAEILVRQRLAEEAARAPAPPGVEARLEALLAGADALGRAGLAEQADVLLAMYRELEAPAPVEGEPEPAPLPAPVPEDAAATDATAARLDALERRVGELAASVAELVELLKAR